jgi:hypothetical protein
MPTQQTTTVFGWCMLTTRDGRPPSLDPVTILSSKYQGVYEGGRFVAFPCRPSEVPAGHDEGDAAAGHFYGEEFLDAPIGRGETPDAAYADLVRRMTVILDREPTARAPRR